MPARSEVLGNRPIGGEKPLCLVWGLEPLHAAFPLPCWLVRVLGAVVEIPVLAVFYAVRMVSVYWFQTRTKIANQAQSHTQKIIDFVGISRGMLATVPFVRDSKSPAGRPGPTLRFPENAASTCEPLVE
jgi:hypothetical protein